MTHAQTKEDKNNRKKIGIILIGLLVVIALIFGSLFAFFSDVITGDTTLTAGTLGLAVQSEYRLMNDPENPVPVTADNINPGDVIEVRLTVTNQGNKSAWVQFGFEITGEDMFGDDLTFAQLQSAFTFTGLTADNGVFTSDGTDILNGTGAHAETETGGVNSLVRTFTITFNSTAGNAWQNAVIDIDWTARAVQFRNNPTPNWASAEALTTAQRGALFGP